MTDDTKQALLDKQEILNAIESRMAKLGDDHDTLIRIEETLKTSIADRETINEILFGKDKQGGLVASQKYIKSQMKWYWFLGGGMFSALVYLVALHIK